MRAYTGVTIENQYARSVTQHQEHTLIDFDLHREGGRENHCGDGGGGGVRVWGLCGGLPLVPLHAPHHLHLPPLPVRDDEAGPGVREGRHIPAGQGQEGWSCGPRTVLRPPVPGCHPDRRYVSSVSSLGGDLHHLLRLEDHHLRRASPGDLDQGQRYCGM